MFIVTCVEYGETCDGHSRILGKFETHKEAEDWVREDMVEVMDMSGEVYEDPDFVRHELWVEGEKGTHGCIWDILDTNSIND